MQEYIEDVRLHETTRERYLNYALSVITSRALPDVRDGLKPVQRRILYAMSANLRLSPEAKHKKSAAVVGEVMAKYHPHGDQSIYDAMVRMAQDWVLRYPMVDGQGNFGSIDGDSPAAMRYTEARLNHIAEELLDELKKDTVDFRANYDGTLKEPVALPAQIPNLLINGAAGIAVGMATNIPPHNLGEVVSALIALIDDPELTLEAIVSEHIKAPDFPTGGLLLTPPEEMLEIYRTGRGPVEMRGEWELEAEGHRKSVVVTSVPYGVDKSKLIGEIAELIRKEKVPMLVDIRDESTEDVRIVMDMKRNANADAAMAFLYKKTMLQRRFNVNMTALCPVEGTEIIKPLRLDLRSILEQFLQFRHQVTRRRLAYDLRQLEKRIHILEGFVKIFDGLDEAIRLIRESEGKSDARDRLMKRFDLDWDQAEAILETKLYRLAKLEIDSIRAELAEKEAAAQAIRDVLASDKLTWDLIRSELVQIVDAYGDPRRSKLTGPIRDQHFTAEHYIVREDSFVIVTRQSRFKRQKSYTDISAIRVRDGDEVGWVMPANTRESLILFTSRGKAYTVRVADIVATTGYGDVIQTRFDFGDGEHIVGVTTTDPRCQPVIPEELFEGLPEDQPKPPYAFAVSRRGKCLRFALDAYRDPSNRAGRTFMRLSGVDDGVTQVEMTVGDEIVSLASQKGRYLLYPLAEVNVLSGAGKGVNAIKLDRDDYTLGYKLVTNRMDGLEVETTRGRVEVLRPNKFKVTSRGGRGRELIRVGYLKAVTRPPQEIKKAVEEELPDDEASDAVEGAEGQAMSDTAGQAEAPSGDEGPPTADDASPPPADDESQPPSEDEAGAAEQASLFDALPDATDGEEAE